MKQYFDRLKVKEGSCNQFQVPKQWSELGIVSLQTKSLDVEHCVHSPFSVGELFFLLKCSWFLIFN